MTQTIIYPSWQEFPFQRGYEGYFNTPNARVQGNSDPGLQLNCVSGEISTGYLSPDRFIPRPALTTSFVQQGTGLNSMKTYGTLNTYIMEKINSLNTLLANTIAGKASKLSMGGNV